VRQPSGLEGCVKEVMVGRELAHRVRSCGVPGELEGLATATAEVDLLARATAARLDIHS
jgi:hypothetical protein